MRKIQTNNPTFSQAKAMTDDWEQQESGWWTHPLYGGIVRNGRKFEAYPFPESRAHSCSTLAKAKEVCINSHAQASPPTEEEGQAPD